MPRAVHKFSPSECHRIQVSSSKPALRYAGGDVRAWQGTLRRKLKQLLGSRPATKTPLRVRRLWRRHHELGTIEKIVFTSEPGADVPAYLCLPASSEPPYPFMICLQGHSTGMHQSIGVQYEDERKPMAIEGDRDFAIGCLRRGVGALCIEQRSFGYRKELKQTQRCAHNGCHDAAVRSFMLGRTLIGERVYDVERGLDVLARRDDVDMKRVGVMGNSGGGTITMFAAATLPRLACAMPSCCFCTYAESILSICHCSCNCVPGLYTVADMQDVLGLFAPKPVVIVAGKDDAIFPIRGVRRAFRDLKAIYRAAGAADRCHLVVGQEGHRFYADQAWKVLAKEMGKR